MTYGSMDDCLRRYLDDIRKTEILVKDEEQSLFDSYRGGSRVARNRLIQSNMRFVVKVALEYRTCPMPLSDIISEGAVGLIHAVETFQVDRGVKFISFAVWWIRSHITKALNEKGYMIRLPSNQYNRLRKAQKTERLGKPVEADLRTIKQLSLGCVSLDGLAGMNRTWSDCIADKGAIDPGLNAEVVRDERITRNAISDLTETEQLVLKSSFGFETECPLNLKEVGELVGKSSERVRQIRKNAIDKIRSGEHSVELRDRFVGLLENQGKWI